MANLNLILTLNPSFRGWWVTNSWMKCMKNVPTSSQTFISIFFLSKEDPSFCVRSPHLVTFLVLTCDKWCVWEELEACFIFFFHLLEHLRTQPLQTHTFVANSDKTLFIAEGQLQGKHQKGVKIATPPGSRAAHLVWAGCCTAYGV